MTTFTIRAAGQTNQGMRNCNEDRFAIDADSQLFVVADGTGGEGWGDRAAQLAADLLPRLIWASLQQSGQPHQAIQQALADANQAVLSLADQLGGGACIVSVAMAFRYCGQLFVTWFGDCRAYLVSHGKAQRLTEDHDLRNAFIRAGTLREEEAAHHHIRNVLIRYLGSREISVPFEAHALCPLPGDRLILATDGVWRWVEDHLVSVCRVHPDPGECAATLIQAALYHGGRDNATCVVAAFDPIRVNASWLAWNDGTVARLARSILEEGQFSHLPVLADALEDAGCVESALLEHLRSTGPHTRGCWVLDILLRSPASTVTWVSPH